MTTSARLLRPVFLAVAALAAASAATAQEPQESRLFMAPTVSGDLNDYNLNASADGRTLVFARSEAEFRNARILVAERTADGWSEPRPVDFTDARYGDSDPWLTPDGRALYFVSNRPAEGRSGERQDNDLWRSVRDGDGWSDPEHLGNLVNSPGQELGPELHGGRLYFSSTRRGGAGGLDIYAAPAEGESFGAPAALPAPINTATSESDFTLLPDGRTALMWRVVDGRGVIHVARLADDETWQTPQPLPAAANPGPFNFTPQLSPDGRSLWFATTVTRDGQRAGLADAYETSTAGLF